MPTALKTATDGAPPICTKYWVTEIAAINVSVPMRTGALAATWSLATCATNNFHILLTPGLWAFRRVAPVVLSGRTVCWSGPASAVTPSKATPSRPPRSSSPGQCSARGRWSPLEAEMPKTKCHYSHSGLDKTHFDGIYTFDSNLKHYTEEGVILWSAVKNETVRSCVGTV